MIVKSKFRMGSRLKIPAYNLGIVKRESRDADPDNMIIYVDNDVPAHSDIYYPSLMPSGLSLANGAVITNIDISFDELSSTFVSVAHSVSFDRIETSLEHIVDALRFHFNERILHIGDMDPQMLRDIDTWTMGHMLEIPFEVDLHLGILNGGDGYAYIALVASDGVPTVRTHPIIIATVDEKDIGELDLSVIPDSIPAEDYDPEEST